DLGDAVAVAEVDEQQCTVMAVILDPTVQDHVAADVVRAEVSTAVRTARAGHDQGRPFYRRPTGRANIVERLPTVLEPTPAPGLMARRAASRRDRRPRRPGPALRARRCLGDRRARAARRLDAAR